MPCGAFGVGQAAFGDFPERLGKGHQQGARKVHHGGSHVVPWEFSAELWGENDEQIMAILL